MRIRYTLLQLWMPGCQQAVSLQSGSCRCRLQQTLQYHAQGTRAPGRFGCRGSQEVGSGCGDGERVRIANRNRPDLRVGGVLRSGVLADLIYLGTRVLSHLDSVEVKNFQ
jgi:hypothetical protein